MELQERPYYNERVIYQQFGYPKEFMSAKPLRHQIAYLGELLNLKTEQALLLSSSLPAISNIRQEGAEYIEWYALPSLTALSSRFTRCEHDENTVYLQCLELLCLAIKRSRPFDFWYNRRASLKFSCTRHKKTADALKVLEERQPGDILLVPAQFGILQVEQWPQAFNDGLEEDEFSLGLFEVLAMTLVHPERFNSWSNLNLDCLGDVVTVTDDRGKTNQAIPMLSYEREKLYAGYRGLQTNNHFGVATAFMTS